MEQIPVTQARAQLSELVLRVGYGRERIVLTKHGRPIAALVPIDEHDSGDGFEAPVGSERVELGSASGPLSTQRWGVAAQDSGPQTR